MKCIGKKKKRIISPDKVGVGGYTVLCKPNLNPNKVIDSLKFCLLSGRFMTIRIFEFGPREGRAPPTKDWLANLFVWIYRDSDEQIVVRSLATTGSRQLLAQCHGWQNISRKLLISD